MQPFKHIIISRMTLKNKELLAKYLKVTKEVLVPCLQSQTNKSFTWGVFIYPEDVEYVRDFLDMDFINFDSLKQFDEYVKCNNENIQTRHDIDDWMSDDYIDKIQEVYLNEMSDRFLIQAQPVRLNYRNGRETEMKKYTSKSTSMFLSLCQRKVEYNIHSEKHNMMYKIAPHVISLPEGYVKWVIHGNNITCRK